MEAATQTDVAGTVEEKMTARELWVNRATSYLGMSFGGMVSMGVLISSAMVLGPRGVIVDSYEQAALMLIPVFGRWGVPLFALALGVGCFGAAVEIGLAASLARRARVRERNGVVVREE